jgi:hypothetical protein
MLSEALQRNAKHEARLSNISDLLLRRIEPEVARDGKPGLAPKAFGAALQLRCAQNDNCGIAFGVSETATFEKIRPIVSNLCESFVPCWLRL